VPWRDIIGGIKNEHKTCIFYHRFTKVALFCLALFGIKIGSFEIKGADQMRYGIDIRGGVEATYEPKDLGRARRKMSLCQPGLLLKPYGCQKYNRSGRHHRQKQR
jgi:preprotein translocase subunit SecF